MRNQKWTGTIWLKQIIQAAGGDGVFLAGAAAARKVGGVKLKIKGKARTQINANVFIHIETKVIYRVIGARSGCPAGFI